MKATTRSGPVRPKLSAPVQPPRQLSIAFETEALQGLAAEQRTAVLQALTAVLLQAAGVHLEEDDDAEH